MLKTSREKVVKSAEKYVSRGKIEAGIKEYRKLLDENPNDISTLNRVGDLYARIERNSEAIELFDQIADQYAEDGFLVKAIAIYKKIIKLDPTLLEIYERLADLYHRQGLVNEARTQYQVLADYYLKHDKLASALKVYERMVELEPANPSHRVKLAELYQGEELVEKALGEYRAIAELMLEHGRGEEAAKVYERGLAVSADDLGFITDGVLKLKEEGHVGAAAKFLALAVEQNPQAKRVARIAGLGEADRAAAAEPGAEPASPPAAKAAEDALGGIDEAVPSADAEGREQEEDVDTREVDGPADSEQGPVTEEAASADLLGEDLEELELDLPGDDDEDSESLVQPPEDMLEDRDRPGAAWSAPERATASETTEPTPPETGGGSEPDTASAPAGAGEASGTGTFEFELDLDADSDELLELATPEEPEEPAEGEAAETEAAARAELADAGTGAAEPDPDDSGIDHDLLERTAAEVHAQPSDGPDDLFTEAEVLAKYGIHEKALERLAELLQRDPRHLQGYQLMVAIHLDAGRHDRAASVARQMAEVAEEVGDEALWPELRDRLEAAGYAVEGGSVRPPEGVEAEPEQEVSAADADAAPRPGPTEQVEEDDLAQTDAVEEGAQRMDAVGEEAIEVELEEDRFELPEVALPDAEEGDVEEEPADEESPPVPSPGPEPPSEEETAAAAESSDGEEAAPTAPRRRGPADVEAALEELAAGLLGRAPRRRGPKPSPEAPARSTGSGEAARPERSDLPSPPTEARPEPPPAPSPPPSDRGPDPLRALGDSLREEIDQGEESGAVGTGTGATGDPTEESEQAPLGAQDPDDTGMSWLDEVSEASEEEDLFAGEEDFFDLGAELEQELSAETSFDAEEELLLSSSEQSLEEIVEGFKRGVAENLSSEDYDTHFNLGIAYREMGLLDEAIGEFQLAAKHPDFLVTCASMLGLCFLEKGLPELAVKWYQRGLEAPEISEEDRLGLLYDLGNAQAATGDPETAYQTFVDLYGINTNYRDVVARLAELEPGRADS